MVLASVAAAYFTVGFAVGDYNPFTILDTMNKKRQKEGQRIRDSTSQRDSLLRLEQEVLNKAEMSDGKPGLSIEDQARLAKRLGYTGTVIEGRRFGLDCKSAVTFSGKPYGDSTPYLRIGNEEINLSEKDLRVYLAESSGASE